MDWIKRYILFHKKRHPKDMGRAEVEAFLTHLAVEGNVAASTHLRPGLECAPLSLSRGVAKTWRGRSIPSAPKSRLACPSSSLAPKRIKSLMRMTGAYQLMAKLLYGSGLRLMECLRLRVKDIDFERREITVRDAKAGHERVTMLPVSLVAPFQEHLKRVKS